MRFWIRDVMELTGISRRALHYYDEMGLLHPKREENGYRYYEEVDLERLQQILFFKELDFPLKEIRNILDDPAFCKEDALLKHRNLLLMEKNRLVTLIQTIDLTLEQKKGGKTMSKSNFSGFSMEEIEAVKKQYAEEAREKYGKTYEESERRTAKYSKGEWNRVKEEGDAIYQLFIDAMPLGSESKEARTAAKRWQEYLTARFYTCTDEILKGLGELYVADERFRQNIDRHRPGLACFMKESIDKFLQDPV